MSELAELFSLGRRRGQLLLAEFERRKDGRAEFTFNMVDFRARLRGM